MHGAEAASYTGLIGGSFRLLSEKIAPGWQGLALAPSGGSGDPWWISLHPPGAARVTFAMVSAVAWLGRSANLPLPVIKTRLWPPGPLRLQAPERCKKMLDLNPGTGISNPSPSSGESANHRFLSGGARIVEKLRGPPDGIPM